MLLSNARNLVLAAGILVLPRVDPAGFTFDNVLLLWVLTSLAYLPLAGAAWWLLGRKAMAQADDVVADRAYPVTQPIPSHYRASFLHFLGGLVAITALQADRFAVAGTLSAYEMGVYFRNVTLASLALQVFSIISFNRVSPRIFALSRNGNFPQAKAMARREYLRFLRLAVAVFAAAVLGNLLLDNPAARYDVSMPFLLVLACGVALRSGADYAGVLLLSVRQDRIVIRNQFVSVLAGIILLVALAIQFGLPGAIAGTVFAPLFCLLLHRMRLLRLL
jgi:O-antigen/teichoic acid export membrane protein